MSHLYMAPNAWDEPTAWFQAGTAEPVAVLSRWQLPDGEGGDLLWSLVLEQVPETPERRGSPAGHGHTEGTCQSNGPAAQDPSPLICSAHPDRRAIGGEVGGNKPMILRCRECMDAAYEEMP